MSRKVNVEYIGRAKTTLPSSVLDGQLVAPMFDKRGRQVFVQHTVRDLIATAQASVTTGTVTELLAGIAGTYLDLVYISFANNSDAAVNVTLKDDGTTVRTFTVPVSTNNGGFIAEKLDIPWPQSAVGGTWDVDMPDITGTTVTVNALFAKN